MINKNIWINPCSMLMIVLVPVPGGVGSRPGCISMALAPVPTCWIRDTPVTPLSVEMHQGCLENPGRVP